MTAERVRGRPLPLLRRWRESKYLTQTELAERAGVTRSTVTRGESGLVVGFPSIRHLAEALEISPDELVYSDPDAARGAPAEEGDHD